MRTAIGIPAGMPGIPYYQGSLYKHKPRHGKTEKKSPSPKRGNNDFLTGKLFPVAPPEIWISTEEEEINVATAENYRRLLSSAENYARLVGQELKVKKGRNPSHSISLLYDALDILIPQHLNIEQQDGKLSFCLYEYHQWDDYTFYWLPISFAETLPAKLKRITLTFIHLFVSHQGIYSVSEMPFFDYVVEYLMELEEDDDLSAKQCREISGLASSYYKGNIWRKLNNVQKKGYYKDLPRAMEHYATSGRKERKLVSFIHEGLELIKAGQPSILDYRYNPYEEDGEEKDYPPVELDRMILLTYDINDRINEDMADSANAELRESYALAPVTTCLLSPDTREPFHKDDYPERFCKWFTEFTQFINKNFK